MRWRPPLIFGGVLEVGAYHSARRLLRDRMVKDSVRSQAPNRVRIATLPSIDSAEQLLPGHTKATFHSSDPATIPPVVQRSFPPLQTNNNNKRMILWIVRLLTDIGDAGSSPHIANVFFKMIFHT